MNYVNSFKRVKNIFSNLRISLIKNDNILDQTQSLNSRSLNHSINNDLNKSSDVKFVQKESVLICNIVYDKNFNALYK